MYAKTTVVVLEVYLQFEASSVVILNCVSVHDLLIGHNFSVESHIATHDHRDSQWNHKIASDAAAYTYFRERVSLYSYKFSLVENESFTIYYCWRIILRNKICPRNAFAATAST